MTFRQKLNSVSQRLSDAAAAIRQERQIAAENYLNLAELLGPSRHRLLQVAGQPPLIVDKREFKRGYLISLLRYRLDEGNPQLEAQVTFVQRGGLTRPIHYRAETPHMEYAIDGRIRAFGHHYSGAPTTPERRNQLGSTVAAWWAELETRGYFAEARKLNGPLWAAQTAARNTRQMYELTLGDVRATISTKKERAKESFTHSIDLYTIRPDGEGTLRPSHVFRPGDLQNLCT